MFDPIATYRIQFHSRFTFRDFEAIIPYLQKLGVKTIYASPIFEAVPDSTHGYDGLHPHRINPEIGTEAELRQLHEKLSACGISWIQDIVPNHMAFHPSNEWLMDVLEKGERSPYFSFFDMQSGITQEHKLMVPFLGASFEEAVQKGEIKIGYHKRLVFQYYDAAYPLHPQSYAAVLWPQEEYFPEGWEALLAALGEVMEEEAPTAFRDRWEEWLSHFDNALQVPELKSYLETKLAGINLDSETLLSIAEQQVYRLCHWQETDSHINFRRFFTVNGLICLNMQDSAVFEEYHQLILQLTREGIFQGLRIDHIDGLYDPTRYLEQLRQAVGEDVYIIVEKILESEEKLPAYWPVQGNTGYDFLAVVNNLFSNRKARAPFTQYYYGIAGDQRTVPQQVRDSKAHILYQHMAGELDNLCRLLYEQGLAGEGADNVPAEDLKKAIAAFLIYFPVYRYYSNSLPLREEEAIMLRSILEAIRQSNPDLHDAIGSIEQALLVKPAEGDDEYNLRAVHFFKRCMQFSGPLMAKGVEDTLMYVFNRFVGHNEVGDAVDAFGMSPENFHRKMAQRQEASPLSLNGTSTHDTKRGEDVRARLNVLTDRPKEWLKTVAEWSALNADLKTANVPDANDEYFIYQTLVGAYPMPGESDEDFKTRLEEYLQKALREAKRHSNWTTPDEAYETATKNFATGLLDQGRPFWKSLMAFGERIARFSIINSLSQVLLKFTCPGVPDIYQGCEGWDLSLVDPDNRRPVDYKKRQSWLNSFSESDEAALVNELWKKGTDARLKLWLTHKLLGLRQQQAQLFAEGDYTPLKVSGALKEHVFAFARHYRGDWIVVAVPLNVAAVAENWESVDWKDTKIELPPKLKSEWESALSNDKGKSVSGVLVKELFGNLPFSVLNMKEKVAERGAGVLLHISSLPSPFGIGDLGPEAAAFIRFLSKGRQKFWQLLPINPTEAGQGHSPYSSISSRAGNPLFISPELLVKEGWLEESDLADRYLSNEAKAYYAEAERVKGELFEIAWKRFSEVDKTQHAAFDAFSEAEKDWLDDFALYKVLKKQFEGKPWFEWPEGLKLRDEAALTKLRTENAEAIRQQQWLQFVFYSQWNAFKKACNEEGIKLIGDLPFYISYDSVDVWSNQRLFNLDENGNRLGVAGVPPDAFSADGQLWGMPVFRWDVMKEDGYGWWIGRLKKNSELFDLVRLDHFRAFADYWEVPATAATAKEGEWKPGPGSHFFTAIKEALGGLPLVAEDLGEINDAVLDLRDEFDLPGMKILQFAFGEDLPASSYIPHNYEPNFIAYTGTHDNNTTRGWYQTETDSELRHRINGYLAQEVTADNISFLFSRMAYASVAKTVILPMQDLLNLDESARMNTPASGDNNWAWRLLPGQADKALAKQLKEWTKLFNRI